MDVTGKTRVSGNLVVTGDISVPMGCSSVDSSVPVAGDVSNVVSDIATLKKAKSVLGSALMDGTWYGLISARHRNGSVDGTSYGLYLRSPLKSSGNLSWGKQYDSSSWQAERTILDSSNYDSYLNTGVKDISSSSKTTFAYSKSGLSYGDYTWLAAWNGYELRAVNKNQFAQASHSHSYLPLSGGTVTGNIKMASGKEVVGGHLGWGCTEGNGIYGFADATTYLEIRTASHGAKGINWWDSDASLKKNIKNTEVRYALEKISQLKHIEFDWKENDSHVDLGYVADDVEKILPCLVFDVAQYDEDGNPNGEVIKNIDYRTMIPLITMGMQELIEERDLLWTFDEEAANCIIKLREEVDSLKSTVNELKAEIESLKKAISV